MPIPVPVLPKESFQVVLLGPGQGQPRDYAKRCQVQEELRSNGYSSTRLGEEVIGADPPIPLHLALIHSLEEIDLILVLETGPAPLVELTMLSLYPEARKITSVWCRREDISARRTTPGDLVRMFEYHLFNPIEFEICDLTSEFIDIVNRKCLDKAEAQGMFRHLGLPPQ